SASRSLTKTPSPGGGSPRSTNRSTAPSSHRTSATAESRLYPPVIGRNTVTERRRSGSAKARKRFSASGVMAGSGIAPPSQRGGKDRGSAGAGQGREVLPGCARRHREGGRRGRAVARQGRGGHRGRKRHRRGHRAPGRRGRRGLRRRRPAG